MISTNQFRGGLFIKIDRELYVILESQHHKPGKGGAFVRTKLKNLRSNAVIDKTFRAGETVQDIFIEEKKYQFLYGVDGQYHFMCNETYEQISLTREKLGGSKDFMKENSELTFSMHEGEILEIKLPIFVNLKITETEPGARGDTVKAGSKTARLETGATIQVPLFVNSGEVVTIDTRTGKYVGRA